MFAGVLVMGILGALLNALAQLEALNLEAMERGYRMGAEVDQEAR